jgi:hypothetical protein
MCMNETCMYIISKYMKEEEEEGIRFFFCFSRNCIRFAEAKAMMYRLRMYVCVCVCMYVCTYVNE